MFMIELLMNYCTKIHNLLRITQSCDNWGNSRYIFAKLFQKLGLESLKSRHWVRKFYNYFMRFFKKDLLPITSEGRILKYSSI